mmetsp:Transcript_11245/g.17677  ORF Transcript_11245/g.17677 Transcript_11245/m.17677 type:complete len:324 (-) Transcript_11245:106-1077(-)
MDWDGDPLFLTQIGDITRAYFILNGIVTFLFILRIIQLARINPKFSLLSESLDQMKYRLLNFAIVLFLLLFFFTLMAMILFGDKLVEFSDLGSAFVSTTQILIGAGDANRQSAPRRGGGFGKFDGADYPEMTEFAQSTAWLFYYPFVMIMVFVVINITIAIIGEAYTRVKKMRDPEEDDYGLCPSEAIKGSPTSVIHQISSGVKHRVTRLFGRRHAHMLKGEVVKFINQLPEDTDKDIISERELVAIGEPLGMTLDKVRFLQERYPFIVNTMDDLESYLEERMPPPTGSKKMLEGVAASVETVIHTQAAIHAKLDLLIRMASV